MRKKLFKFFLWSSLGLLGLIFLLFTELSYVGVKIQYFLIPTIIITSFLSWLFYKKDSDFWD